MFCCGVSLGLSGTAAITSPMDLIAVVDASPIDLSTEFRVLVHLESAGAGAVDGIGVTTDSTIV